MSSATSVDDVVLLLEWRDRLYRLSDFKRRSTPEGAEPGPQVGKPESMDEPGASPSR